MSQVPDVVGYEWDEALKKIGAAGYEVVEALITGPRQLGVVRRVVRQKLAGDYKLSLVIAYFEPGRH